MSLQSGNEIISGAVHRSPGICLTGEENPGKPQLGDRLSATSHHLKWGPTPPNEVGKIALHVRKRKWKERRIGQVLFCVHGAIDLSSILNSYVTERAFIAIFVFLIRTSPLMFMESWAATKKALSKYGGATSSGPAS